MATHVVHPDAHTNGLADGCPRCEEHAMRPFDSLDDENLGMLMCRIRDKLPARSDNEYKAMQHVKNAINICKRLTQVAEDYRVYTSF